MLTASADMPNGAEPVEWSCDLSSPAAYEDAVAFMEARTDAIRNGMEGEIVRLLEHPPLYTAGTSANPDDLLTRDRFPVFETGRGGQYTYHGPGQIVGYAMLDLSLRGQDVRAYVHDLEEWLIDTLRHFGITGERREGRVGIWVRTGKTLSGAQTEKKIAAIGVRVRKWVSFHGVALNVEPDLSHYDGIVPCGISEHGVTSLVDLGVTATMDEAAEQMRRSFERVFGRQTVAR